MCHAYNIMCCGARYNPDDLVGFSKDYFTALSEDRIDAFLAEKEKVGPCCDLARVFVRHVLTEGMLLGTVVWCGVTGKGR